jgi:hypothetical protein
MVPFGMCPYSFVWLEGEFSWQWHADIADGYDCQALSEALVLTFCLKFTA